MSRRLPSLRRTTVSAGFALAFGALAAAPAGAATGAVLDCPLARTPYSADTPIIDLLIDKRAKAMVDATGLLAKAPPVALRTTPPSFASILSLRVATRTLALDAAVIADLEKRLAALPIRPEDSAARCARYEADARHSLAVPAGRPALLIFDRSNGFRDGPSVEAATEALRAIGERRGWSFVFSSSAGDFTPRNLKRFRAVLWNNVSGDMLTMGQRSALRRYIERGGGFAAIHGSGGDPLYLWDWYVDELIGARFIGHPDAHQKGRVLVENPDDPLTAGIAHDWAPVEEWYSFAKSPRGPRTRVLLSLDETSYKPTAGGRDLSMGDHPIAWIRCVGRGRSFYSAIGHRPENYRDPNNVRLIEQGIAWSMGLSPSGCRRDGSMSASLPGTK